MIKLTKSLTETIDNDKYDEKTFVSFIDELSTVIPIFFSIDEIQQFEQNVFSANDFFEEETSLHYFT